MRLAPIAIAFHRHPGRAEAMARAQSETTHRAAEAVDGAAMLCRILVAATNGVPKRNALRPPFSPKWAPRIREVAAGFWEGKPRDQISSSGYVVHTLEAALWAVDRTNDFREAVLLAANLGGDADTVVAVTGQIAGALYGASAIPRDWQDRLAWCERIIETAERVHAFADPD